MFLRYVPLLLLALAAQAETFSFGLWGDMPYAKAGDASHMQALIDSMNRSDIAFSIYDGDIKDGSSLCTDEVFDQALNLFGQLKQPMVYVPGDNEWTDCHRSNNGGYDNLERLARLRQKMFPTLASLGKRTLALMHQGKLGEPYVENTRFIHKGIVFVGLNIPGSNNNLVLDSKDCSHKSARTPNQCEADNAEYRERDVANIEWLKEAFQLARERKLRGLVMVFQADPGFDLPETEDVDESLAPHYQGYRNFIKQVVAEAEQYQGQVLLVHGDTHFFKLDKPLYSPTRVLPNLTRLQTFGSPLIHWVRVTVDGRDPNVFTVHPVMVKQTD
ncbi:hypothetical protein [Chitinimonas sp.]|uniref:hypothetical protein n=1 Tax=Chitinimonas sp. TaxID=1934313 RepID=UPI002F91DB8E